MIFMFVGNSLMCQPGHKKDKKLVRKGISQYRLYKMHQNIYCLITQRRQHSFALLIYKITEVDRVDVVSGVPSLKNPASVFQGNARLYILHFGVYLIYEVIVMNLFNNETNIGR